MMESLRQRAWRRISVSFPERQIYIRSDGRVQFFTFSSHMQAICAGVSLAFLGWVSFTSVNVIFKDRILAAKQRHFEEMQASYETRIADLQLSYDELNGSLILAQDRFKTVADSLEAKQQVLTAVIEHKSDLEASLRAGKATGPTLNAKTTAMPPLRNASGIGGVFDPLTPNAASTLVPPMMQAAIPAGPETESLPAKVTAPVQAAPRVPFLSGVFQRLGSLFHRKVSLNTSDQPALKVADSESKRIVRLELAETTLLSEATQDVSTEAARLGRALKATGIDTKSLIGRLSRNEAQMSPLIPFELSSEGDDTFSAGVAETGTAMEKLHEAVMALNAVPLLSPTQFGSVSSEYGGRIDPFNEQLAFHSGIDFSGPKGSEVRATGPGIVVFAGKQGEYGNTVEVDHGNGIRTRYAHLSKILVPVGARVERGATIGDLGSTGRSTGPHVHYEVWYDDAVRDPGKFIKAGHDVLEE